VPKRRARKKPTNKVHSKVEAPRPSEFDKLLRFIVTFWGRFALAFICGEDRRQRQGVLASLADLLKDQGIELRQVDLSYREVTDLLSTFREECRQSSPAAIVVTGLEASLKGPLLATLNLQRDLISRDIKCPLLFWVSNFALNVLAREAPDLYDFRHTVFNFQSAEAREFFTPRDTVPTAPTLPRDQGQSSPARTAYLLDQLAKYQRDESYLKHGDKLAYGELLEEVARSYRDERHRMEGLIYLEQALDIYRKLQEKGREASVLSAMADIYYFSDNQARAAETLAKALPLYRAIGSQLGEANTLQSLGEVKRMQDAYAEAEKLYVTALHIYASIDDKYSQGMTLLSLAETYRSLGDQQKARAVAGQVKALCASFPQLVQRSESILQELS
jgi:tetratricopeptide (TPR) repeat protein